MADEKLSALPSGAAVTDADLSYWAQAGASVKQAASALWTYIEAKIIAVFNPRTILTGNLNLYVDPLGSNNYNGLSATYTGGVNGPKATIQAAVEIALALDCNGFMPSISVADGTYNESLFLGALTGLSTNTAAQIADGLAFASIVGNTGSPGNVILNYPDSGATGVEGVNVFGPGAIWVMDGITRQCAGNVNFTYGLLIGFGGIFFDGNINMGSTGGGPQISVTNSAQYNGFSPVNFSNTITVSGSAEKLIECGRHVVVDFEPGTLTLNSPTFTGATITEDQQSLVIFAPGSSSGTATGQRYQLKTGSGLVTFGGGPTSIPGDSPGTIDSSSSLDGIPGVLTNADQLLTGGANVTAASLTTGNIAIDCGLSPLQEITNGGAFTITAPANDGSTMLLVTNNAGAGAITFSGFSVGSNTGDSLDSTNGHLFTISIWRINGISGYRIAAMQ